MYYLWNKYVIFKSFFILSDKKVVMKSDGNNIDLFKNKMNYFRNKSNSLK